ncbi:MAG: adenylate/guanylate cyclase domain-containing protein, partial [Halobacteriales archaeon]|nr:adenylate/guanylate cyclase domain-containing protein [Halobacteriales archaeon]
RGPGVTTELRRVCVMFMDIRDFTTFSETRTPDEVVEFLNRLFEPLVDVVSRHQGIINKFLGDGFMAVFGAPVSDGRDTENAVRAALEMIDVVDGLRTAGTIPDVEIGIALHTGEVTTGTVGSRRRKEYTVIGDTVNVASRLEGLNRRFGSRLIVSGGVWEEVRGRFPDLTGTEIEPVRVKGRSRPVPCYRLVDARDG